MLMFVCDNRRLPLKGKPMIGTDDLIHPGEILLEEFMRPIGLSQNRLATALSVPVKRINAVVRCKRPVTADLALRLSSYFGTSVEFWLNLQNSYDLDIARIEMENEKRSRQQEKVLA